MKPIHQYPPLKILRYTVIAEHCLYIAMNQYQGYLCRQRSLSKKKVLQKSSSQSPINSTFWTLFIVEHVVIDCGFEFSILNAHTTHTLVTSDTELFLKFDVT